MMSIISCDGQHAASRGVVDFLSGTAGKTWLIEDGKQPTRLPNVVQVNLQPGQRVRGRDSAGGGYGNGLDRDPDRVLIEVLEGWETRQKADDTFGVVFEGEVDDEYFAVDTAATQARRDELRKACAE